MIMPLKNAYSVTFGFIIALLLMGCMQSLEATYSAFNDLRDQVAELEAKVNELVQKNQLGTEGAHLPSGYPQLVESKNIFIYIDPLIVHAKVNGTTYAYTSTGNANQLPIRADSQQIKFGWNGGIRCGIGYWFPKKDVTLDVSYTWIESNASQKVQSGILGSVMPLKGVTILGQGVNWAKSYCSVEQDTILAKVSKSYFVSPSVMLIPYGGLKNTWIDLEQWTQYFGGTNLSNNVLHVRDSSDFWGIGPAIGASGKLYLGRNVYLMGDVSGALQYGLFRIQYDESQSNLSAQRIKINESFHQFAPNFEMNLGAEWSTYWNRHRNYFSIGAAYHVEYWFSQNQFIDILQENARRYFNLSEDISFHGLEIYLQLDF
ncbi:MAG: hypothetical protein K9M07_02705 [Simkaniaceae bacterium]|nr:hypothetical protein [Simkaniaceae bacterium]